MSVCMSGRYASRGSLYVSLSRRSAFPICQAGTSFCMSGRHVSLYARQRHDSLYVWQACKSTCLGVYIRQAVWISTWPVKSEGNNSLNQRIKDLTKERKHVVFIRRHQMHFAICHTLPVSFCFGSLNKVDLLHFLLGSLNILCMVDEKQYSCRNYALCASLNYFIGI